RSVSCRVAPRPIQWGKLAARECQPAGAVRQDQPSRRVAVETDGPDAGLDFSRDKTLWPRRRWRTIRFHRTDPPGRGVASTRLGPRIAASESAAMPIVTGRGDGQDLAKPQQRPLTRPEAPANSSYREASQRKRHPDPGKRGD